MRKVILAALLFVSTITVAQNIQNTFFGYKLNSSLSEKQLIETIKEKYSRNVFFNNDDPKTVGITDGIKLGGYEWDEAHITIYKPQQRFLGVELIETGTITSSCKKRYDELRATLTEKYGEPVTTNNHNHMWTRKNGINVILVYEIAPFHNTEYSTLSEALGEITVFDKLTLKYWDVSVEEKVKQYEKDQL